MVIVEANTRALGCADLGNEARVLCRIALDHEGWWSYDAHYWCGWR